MTAQPGIAAGIGVPDAWYNVLPDLGFDLPPDLPPEDAPAGVRVGIPMGLVRQEMSRRREIAIPDEVMAQYADWRPTLMRRARGLEAELGTRCRIYVKYEGGNISGSHKLNTAIAQVHYYRAAGARTLTVGTGAGQWGTAVAAACQRAGLGCRVYMVRTSYEAKPYRRTLMETLGAEVIPSPSTRTPSGRKALEQGDAHSRQGSLSVALAEAVEDAVEDASSDTFFCTGSSETYTLLHQSVIGLECMAQMAAEGDFPDLIVGSLGGGSNFGGLVLPFLGAARRGEKPSPEFLSVEPQASPKLTRGRYAYDYTDASRRTPRQMMFTLGHQFQPPGIHAGGLRYHGAAKLVSALYSRREISAVAYPQPPVFEAAQLLARTEGILPAPEAAHAVLGACNAAREADRAGHSRCILVGVSGHGLLDLSAYRDYIDGQLVDVEISDDMIASSLANLPAQGGSLDHARNLA